MDHYVWLGCTSTPRALKDSLNLGQPTALVQSPRAVGFPCFKLPLSARGVVKYSLTNRKSIVITFHLMPTPVCCCRRLMVRYVTVLLLYSVALVLSSPHHQRCR